MRLYIRRKEEDAVRAIGNWTLIYGRRKTGKTTLLNGTCVWTSMS